MLLENKDVSAMANDISELEKSLKTALITFHTVEQEILMLQKEILERQCKKKDLELQRSKASHNVKQISLDVKIAQQKFWAAKES